MSSAPDDVLAEERELQFAAFDHGTAWELGQELVRVARESRHPVVVDITVGEQQVFHAALAGSSADNDVWVQRKNRVVRRFGHSSYYMGLVHGAAFADTFLLDPLEYAAHGGAFPLTVRGAGVIGTVTVSGLPQEDDHRLVVDVLRRFLSR